MASSAEDLAADGGRPGRPSPGRRRTQRRSSRSLAASGRPDVDQGRVEQLAVDLDEAGADPWRSAKSTASTPALVIAEVDLSLHRLTPARGGPGQTGPRARYAAARSRAAIVEEPAEDGHTAHSRRPRPRRDPTGRGPESNRDRPHPIEGTLRAEPGGPSRTAAARNSSGRTTGTPLSIVAWCGRECSDAVDGARGEPSDSRVTSGRRCERSGLESRQTPPVGAGQRRWQGRWPESSTAAIVCCASGSGEPRDRSTRGDNGSQSPGSHPVERSAPVESPS